MLEHIDITESGERVFLNRTAGAQNPNVPFTEKSIVSILKQVLSVVQFLHKEGIVHRDIKLENVLLTRPFTSIQQGATRCKLIDFGLSKKMEEGACRSACGSAYYAAPEIMACQAGGKLYGLEVGTLPLYVYFLPPSLLLRNPHTFLLFSLHPTSSIIPFRQSLPPLDHVSPALPFHSGGQLRQRVRLACFLRLTSLWTLLSVPGRHVGAGGYGVWPAMPTVPF